MSKGLTSKWLKGEATPHVTEHQKKLSVLQSEGAVNVSLTDSVNLEKDKNYLNFQIF